MYKVINFIERGIKIFMYNNIPVFINPLLILMFLFIDFSNSYDIIVDAVLMVSIFSAILVHELGHFVMSNSDKIYLTFFNKIETDRLLVAIGGVLFNLIFSILLYGLLRLVHYYNVDNPMLEIILISNISINLLLGLFNSLPIIPLDGMVALKIGIGMNKYISYSISILTSILMILFSIYIGNIYMITFSLLFTGYSISEFEY